MPPLPGVSHAGCCFVSSCSQLLIPAHAWGESGIFHSRERHRIAKSKRKTGLQCELDLFSSTDHSQSGTQIRPLGQHTGSVSKPWITPRSNDECLWGLSMGFAWITKEQSHSVVLALVRGSTIPSVSWCYLEQVFFNYWSHCAPLKWLCILVLIYASPQSFTESSLDLLIHFYLYFCPDM